MTISRAHFTVYGSGSLSVIGASLLLACAAGPALASPVHTADAESLLSDLTKSRQNVYGSSPSYIQWSGSSSKARTVCGTFVTNLLMHSYNWTTSTFSSWMGTTSPSASVWHDNIVAQNNFTQITNISQVLPGDIIAIKYPPGSGVTGHAMMVDSVPRAKSSTQYAVTVIDSSSGHHGQNDTRVTNPSDSGNGVGRGDVMIYVTSSGQLDGYAWSTESGSQHYSASSRPMAIGRIASFGRLRAASVAPGSHAADEVTVVPDDETGALSDDESVLGGGKLADGEPMVVPQAGGCSAVAGAQTGAALPAGLFGLLMLLGMRLSWRRRAESPAL